MMTVSFAINSADDARAAAEKLLALADSLAAPGRRQPAQVEPAAVAKGVGPANTPAIVVPAAPPSEPLSIEAARVKLREAAMAKGVEWLRPILQRYGIARLSDLPDYAVMPVLAEASNG